MAAGNQITALSVVLIEERPMVGNKLSLCLTEHYAIKIMEKWMYEPMFS